ncbi:MAG: hypothetical protein EXR86_15755 [Gammaproteobacteria bacterium]|nr:hypothetical protein [Gammaproteobacteria bacterium]
MYTQCPSCQSLFEANAQSLRTAMGMLRCTHCATVFNALYLRAEPLDSVNISERHSVGSTNPRENHRS